MSKSKMFLCRCEDVTLKEFQSALGKNTDRPVFMRVFKPRQGQSIFIAVPR